MKDAFDIVHCLYTGHVLGPEEMDDNCRKTVCGGMMDRGFTLYHLNGVVKNNTIVKTFSCNLMLKYVLFS